jgi:hypothetical protein
MQAVKREEFVRNRMPHTTPNCHLCDIVLNVHASTENKCDHTRDSLNKDINHVFNQFFKYQMKILLVIPMQGWRGKNFSNR